MIVVSVVVTVFAVASIVALGTVAGLRKRVEILYSEIDKLKETTAGVYAIRALHEEIVELKRRVDELPQQDLGDVLEKKWEDAIQRISNFDPFGEEDR